MPRIFITFIFVAGIGKFAVRIRVAVKAGAYNRSHPLRASQFIYDIGFMF